MSKSIDFFETQFRRQLANSDLELNPFEAAILPHLQGQVLDFGCGLGNLAVAATRQGCSVLALDAAPTAIRHLAARAAREALPIRAAEADLRHYEIGEDFDAVVSIGLLMFLDCTTARRQLARLRDRVRPGGISAINVLVDGTTYAAMFDPASHCLFGRDEVRETFAGWEILDESFADFPAPGATVKSFVTLVARRPAGAA
ncbi:MAG TPA: class I SAM-dependent methyltransferase [Rhodocyclaceae bacterium]|nr:class I SAM-dependent methyltransferase [Rhodocyclaceae bacterium]